MDYINDFGKFNQKSKLDADSYVDNNFRVLVQMMNIDEEDYECTDDIKKVLVEYFTRFPDQMSKISIETTGIPRSFNLSLNNIGGVVKYR